MTKEFLDEHQVPFKEIDVAADPAKAMEMREISEQMGVPVTVIDDSVVIGFDKGALTQLLGIAA